MRKRFYFFRQHSFYLLLAVLATGLLMLSFSPQEENFFTVTGRVIYDVKEYPAITVNVRITEDGKNFKSFQCDQKGRFETRLYPDHLYLFYFSADYHATSKAELNTNIPEADKGEYVGGLFAFECEIFELLEGLNLALLNAPLVKFKYITEKKEFDYDRKHTERILYNLEGFRAEIADLKSRRREVLKDEDEAKKRQEMVVAQQGKKERKVIEFESEKNKPKAVNTTGARNIMDKLDEDTDDRDDAIAQKYREADSIMKESEALALEESPEIIEAEEMELEEAIDASDLISLIVIPKRVEISSNENENLTESEEVTAAKRKVQEATEVKRIGEESKIKEEMLSFTLKTQALYDKRLYNKKIQNRMIDDLIRRVALAEIYFKQAYFKLHPNEGYNVKPSLFTKTRSNTWFDKEFVTVMYPHKTIHYRKETFLFGLFSYYYEEGTEIDSDTFCRQLAEMNLDHTVCAN
ncbi:MAG: hypothetical protein RIE58_09730 [Vicingaceae bacterium]